MQKPRSLIEEITHCGEVDAVWQGDADHPCRKIVHTQPTSPEEFQVPEPWAGHLSQAPLLFISSTLPSAVVNPTHGGRSPRTSESISSRSDSVQGTLRSRMASSAPCASRTRMEHGTASVERASGTSASGTPAGCTRGTWFQARTTP